MSFQFTPQNQKTFDELLTKYPNKQAALLPTLWLAQNQHGHLPLPVQEAVAKMLDLHPAHVYGVMSFYTMYKDKPMGKFHLQICRTLSCALNGCEGVIRQVEDKLKIKNGQVTGDGKFSLELVECLASCGTGPMMQVNETYVENLNEQKVDELLNKLVNS